jgi:hypothetical protein
VQAQLEKNRQSAKECRIRKKQYLHNLEDKLAEYEAREVERVAELVAARAQVVILERKLQEADASRT